MKPEVPEAVENHLVELYGGAGQTGGGVGGAIGGGAAGAAGGSLGGRWGGKLGARLLRTKVEQRATRAEGTPEEVVARVTAAHRDTTRLPADDRVRLVVPAGGMQEIVVDLEFGAASEGGVPVRVTGYGKEGLFNRSPTRKVTDSVVASITSSG